MCCASTNARNPLIFETHAEEQSKRARRRKRGGFIAKVAVTTLITALACTGLHFILRQLGVSNAMAIIAAVAAGLIAVTVAFTSIGAKTPEVAAWRTYQFISRWKNKTVFFLISTELAVLLPEWFVKLWQLIQRKFR